jgi:hypothetical protein
LASDENSRKYYAVRRGWTINLQVREISSSAAKREAREKLLEAHVGVISM